MVEMRLRQPLSLVLLVLLASLLSSQAGPARPAHHHQRPAASYQRPAPSYPAPAVYHHSPPPPPPPQIQILPAPDLSHSTPAQDSPAVAPAYSAPSEEPAVAPAYQPIYYGQQLAPVYEPQTYEPAVVEPAAVEPAVEEPAVKEVVEVKVAAVIDTKSAEPEELLAEEATTPRQPKLLVETPSPVTGPQAGSQEEIIIDLTQDLDLGLTSLGVGQPIIVSPPEEAKFVEVVEVVEEEVLITGDQSDKEPQIISFKTQQIPPVFAP